MKIALVILHADPARGGAERYTTDLAVALARRGHDVTVIDSTCLHVAALTRTSHYRKFLRRLDDHLAETKYDVVHAMLPVRACDIYHPHAGVAADVVQKPNALFNPRRRLMARVERDLLSGPRPPIVLGLSNYVNAHIRRFYADLAAAHLVRLFNAVDLDRFEPAPPRETPRKEVAALIIANDFERKGVPQAIKAVEMVNDPRLNIDIVGRGYIDESNLHWPIRVWGEVADPGERYRSADFFVLPTRHDPCSLVVLEALAMGLPVISTKFNGATEIMTDGVHGYVLDDPNDVNALAAAMNKMMDPARRAEMSRACIELRPKLSYEHHLDRLIEIYQQAQSARTAAHTSAARASE